MPEFRYTALDAQGSEEYGVLEAPDAPLAAEALISRGLVAIDIRGRRVGLLARLQEPVQFARRVRNEEVGTLIGELASLLSAGLNFDRALGVMLKSERKQGTEKLLQDLRRRLRDGASPSQAFARAPDIFPEYFVRMIEAGEMSGALAEVCERVAHFYANSLAFRRKIVSALIYPMILLALVTVTLVLVVTLVLPEFQDIFDSAGAGLPRSTQFVMAIGEEVTARGWLYLLAVVGITLGAGAALRRPNIKMYVHARLLRLSLFGPLIAQIETSRFFRTLGTMLQNGVNLVAALPISAAVVRNVHLRADLSGLLGPVREGARLGDVLAKIQAITPLALQFARIGEETGDLPNMLLKAADILDAKAAVRAERLMGMLAPILTLIMGGIVAAFIGSVLLGIMAVNDLGF